MLLLKWLHTGKLLSHVQGHKSQVLAVDFSPDCTRMVTASKDGTWRVWNIAVRYHLQEDPKCLLVQQQKVGSLAIVGASGFVCYLNASAWPLMRSQVLLCLSAWAHVHACMLVRRHDVTT